MAGSDLSRKIVAQNRKARHNYFIEDTIEAGIILVGTEVKSLRAGRVNLGDSYAEERAGALYLVKAHISAYEPARLANHEPLRRRKLLLHKREMERLIGKVNRGGYTLVPLSLYFNERGIAKVELAVAKGRRQYDKRQRDKTRDWLREKARLMRAKE